MTEPDRSGLLCVTFHEPTRWERIAYAARNWRRYLRMASWLAVCNLLTFALAIFAAYGRWPWVVLTGVLYPVALGFFADAQRRHRRRTSPGEGHVRSLPDPYLADALRRAVDRMARDVTKRMDGGSK